MTASVLLVTAWFCAFLGAAQIALCNRAHWIAVTGSSNHLVDRRSKTISGSVLLLLAVGLSVLRDGWGIGLLLGPLVIATGIATVIAMLAIRPRSLKCLCQIAASSRADRNLQSKK